MHRIIWRHAKTYRDLRSLNRQHKFQEAAQLYRELPSGPQSQALKAQAQYLYSLSNLSPPSPQGSADKPFYVKRIIGPRTSIVQYIGIAMQLGLLWILYRLSQSQMLQGSIFGSKQHIVAAQKSQVTFGDVKGIDECREQLEEVVEYLLNPHKFAQVGAKMPRGVLLTGNPGVGKTLLAKAIAGEADVRFFSVSGSDFEELFVGLGAKRVRELFQEAKARAPCVVFIDELDALGSSRRGKESNRQSLNQLLVQMDGFSSSENVLVIAATNFPESLDAALTRPGRFDKVVHIPVPDLKGREEILGLYLSRVQTDPTVDKRLIARGTTGMTGADLANLINQAMLNAVRRNSLMCSAEDIESAKDRILMGVHRKGLAMSEDDKMSTAIHEVGHALTAVMTEGAMPVHKATILPRGQALGMTVLIPEKDEVLQTKKQMLARIDVAMGGRAAEEIFFGKDKVTNGCSSDMQAATRVAYFMVKGGMFDEETGVMNSIDVEGEGAAQRDQIDEFVHKLLLQRYQRVMERLHKNKKTVSRIAKELADRETLTREEFMEVLKLKKGQSCGFEISKAGGQKIAELVR